MLLLLLPLLRNHNTMSDTIASTTTVAAAEKHKGSTNGSDGGGGISFGLNKNALRRPSSALASAAANAAGTKSVFEVPVAAETREMVTGLGAGNVYTTVRTTPSSASAVASSKKPEVVIPLTGSMPNWSTARQQQQKQQATTIENGGSGGGGGGSSGSVRGSGDVSGGTDDHAAAVREIMASIDGTPGSDTAGDGSATTDIVVPLLMRNRVPGDIELSAVASASAASNSGAGDTKKYRNDVAQRPPEPTLDAYAAVAVEDFGAGMLRGMGWRKGEAIGGSVKGLAEPIAYVPRPRGLGLGATRDTELSRAKGGGARTKTNKKGRGGKPDSAASQPQLVAEPGADGRTRHVVGVGEKLVAREQLRMVPGAFVAIKGGSKKSSNGTNSGENGGGGNGGGAGAGEWLAPHAGHVGILDHLYPERARVRLGLSEAVVTVAESRLELIGRQEYTRRLERLRKEGVTNPTTTTTTPSATTTTIISSRSQGHHHTSRESSSGGIGRKRTRDAQSTASSDMYHQGQCHPSENRGNGSWARSEQYKHGEEGSHASKRDRRRSPTPPPPWLARGLRVRIVSERLAHGRLYNTKVRVVEVVQPTLCSVLTDAGKLVEGVKQRQLETLVPRDIGCTVMILTGPYRRTLGRLLERDSKRERVWVQPHDDSQPIRLTFDGVCEWTEV